MVRSTLVSMTNGDVYRIRRDSAEELVKKINEKSDQLFVTYDLKLNKLIKLQPLAVSSLVEGEDFNG